MQCFIIKYDSKIMTNTKSIIRLKSRPIQFFEHASELSLYLTINFLHQLFFLRIQLSATLLFHAVKTNMIFVHDNDVLVC